MSDGFPEYKALQKQLDEIDRRAIAQAVDISRIRSVAQSTRDNLEQLRTAILGNELLGMQGLLDRLESLESKLVRAWWFFLMVLGVGAILNITTLYFLFRLLDLYGG